MLPSIQRLTLTALAALPVLITTSSALPLSPRQLSSSPSASTASPSPLRVTYLDSLDSLLQSTTHYHCKPNALAISGATYPVQVDGLSAKGFDAFDNSYKDGVEGEVLASAAKDWLGDVLVWNFAGLEAGEDVVVRVTDAAGRVAYAGPREVRNGGSWMAGVCEKDVRDDYDFWMFLLDFFAGCLMLAGGLLSLAMLVGILYGCVYEPYVEPWWKARRAARGGQKAEEEEGLRALA